MEKPSLEGETRTLQALLRRMKAAAPGLRTVRAFGCESSAFVQACEREELEVGFEYAEAEVHFAADKHWDSSATSARVIGVIASNVSAGSMHLFASRPARRYVTLRDWVAGWFPKNPMLSRLLVSSAVQERYSSNRWPGQTEWILVQDQPQAALRNGWTDRVKYALVTLFGSGAFPIMPATVASALMLPFGVALHVWGGGWAPGIWLAVGVAATWGCIALERWAARWFLAEDPKEFVLDEVAGLALAWAFVPASASWWWIVWAFVLFRVFDIFKWGVDWVEKVPFRGRVVWDDLLAGLYAGVLVWLAIFIASGKSFL